MRRSCRSDFRSSSTILTATNKFGDLEIFAKPQKNGAILIQDFATFIHAIGTVHYLAANSEVRKEKDKEEFGDGLYRIFYRGQNALYGKHCDEMKPSAYRGNGDCTKSIEENLELQSPGFYKSQRDELLNLRQALPSQFIRPHAQHGRSGAHV